MRAVKDVSDGSEGSEGVCRQVQVSPEVVRNALTLARRVAPAPVAFVARVLAVRFCLFVLRDVREQTVEVFV